MSTTHQNIMTARQLLETPELGRCELVRGELITMSPAGPRHGRIAMRLGVRLGAFVEEHDLGIVYAAETGFWIERDPDTVRAPDVGFVRKDRVQPQNEEPAFFPGPPDLAVEVLSPDDRPRTVQSKVRNWLDAGTQAVWVVDPDKKTVTVHRGEDKPRVLDVSDELEDENLLPGFRLNVGDIFGK